MVSEQFEAHEGRVLTQGLREQCQPHVVNVVVCHVEVDEARVRGERLRNRLGSVVLTLVVCEM